MKNIPEIPAEAKEIIKHKRTGKIYESKEAFDADYYATQKVNNRKKNIRSLQRKIASLGLTDQEKALIFG